MPPFFRSCSQNVFNTLSSNLASDTWLEPSNRYKNNPTKILEKKKNRNYLQIRGKKELARYIAASVPLHCIDGWGMLGRSINCLMVGDYGGARHFAYYAQLRAIMSLAALEGVGIFLRRHFNVAMRLSVSEASINSGTHDFVAHFFDKWTNAPDSAELLLSILYPAGISMSSWVDTAGYATASLVGQRMLDEWGYDIDRLKSDRDARNEASYRPQGHDFTKSSPSPETIDFVCSLWETLSPQPSQGFLIDLYLVKQTLDKIYQQRGTSLENEMEKLLDDLSIFGTPRTVIESIFKSTLETRLLQESRYRGAFSSPEYTRAMIARAALLLRLSAGGTKHVFKNAAVAKEDTEFWWREFGVGRGLWDDASTDPLVEMWDDIDSSITTCKTMSGTINSFLDFREKMPEVILALSGTERICFQEVLI